MIAGFMPQEIADRKGRENSKESWFNSSIIRMNMDEPMNSVLRMVMPELDTFRAGLNGYGGN